MPETTQRSTKAPARASKRPRRRNVSKSGVQRESLSSGRNWGFVLDWQNNSTRKLVPVAEELAGSPWCLFLYALRKSAICLADWTEVVRWRNGEIKLKLNFFVILPKFLSVRLDIRETMYNFICKRDYTHVEKYFPLCYDKFGCIDQVSGVMYERMRNLIKITRILFELTKWLTTTCNCPTRLVNNNNIVVTSNRFLVCLYIFHQIFV